MIGDVLASAYCEKCNTLFRIERTQLTGRTGPFLYCPLCGTQGIQLTSDLSPKEYWDALGEDYGMPAELMQEIFHTWDTSQHATLREHIDSLREEALRGVAS